MRIYPSVACRKPHHSTCTASPFALFLSADEMKLVLVVVVSLLAVTHAFQRNTGPQITVRVGAAIVAIGGL